MVVRIGTLVRMMIELTRNLGLPHVRIESCKADALPLSHIPESIVWY